MSSLIHLSVKSQYCPFEEYYDDTPIGFSKAMERFMTLVVRGFFDVEEWDKCIIRRLISESKPELLFSLKPWIKYCGANPLLDNKFCVIDPSNYQFFYESGAIEKGNLYSLLNNYHEGEDLC